MLRGIIDFTIGKNLQISSTSWAIEQTYADSTLGCHKDLVPVPRLGEPLANQLLISTFIVRYCRVPKRGSKL